MPDTDLHADRSAILGRTNAANVSSEALKLHAAHVIAGWAATRDDAADMLDLYGLLEVVEAARDQLQVRREPACSVCGNPAEVMLTNESDDEPICESCYCLAARGHLGRGVGPDGDER